MITSHAISGVFWSTFLSIISVILQDLLRPAMPVSKMYLGERKGVEIVFIVYGLANILPCSEQLRQSIGANAVDICILKT